MAKQHSLVLRWSCFLYCFVGLARLSQAVGDRLPLFTAAQKELLKGSVDFYGLNHYTSKYVQATTPPAPGWFAHTRTHVLTRMDAGTPACVRACVRACACMAGV
jgi:hypothetical protein